MTGPVIEVADPETGELVSLPGLPALPGAGPLGLDLPPSLTWEQWAAYGATLQVAHRSIMWLLGDWLRYGERRFGETYVQAVEATGRAAQSLMNAKWVAERVEPSRRRAALSWSHHADVAVMEPDAQDELLGWAERSGAKRADLREAVRQRKVRDFAEAIGVGSRPREEVPPHPDSITAMGETLSADIAVWLIEGRLLAAQVRRGVPFAVVSSEQDSFDELVELIQVLDRAACDDARRAAA